MLPNRHDEIGKGGKKPYKEGRVTWSGKGRYLSKVLGRRREAKNTISFL